MKLLRVLVLASFGLALAALRAADATSPLDAARRNTAFSPAAAIAPAIQAPGINRVLQDQRVDPAIVEKVPAAMGERRAPVEIKEARDKQVRVNQSTRPTAVELPASAFNHRESAISTGADTKTLPRVAKYQDSLTAASVTNMARFPADGAATVTKINRFVFRKNAPEPQPPTHGVPVVPAGGGSAPQK